MPQVSKQVLSIETSRLIWDSLVKSLVRLDNQSGVNAYLMGLLSETEQIMLSKRLMVGVLVYSGWDVYTIAETLKMSTSTVYKAMNVYQLNSSYQQVLSELFPKKIIFKPQYKQKGYLDRFLSDLFAGRQQRSKLTNLGE